MKLIDIDPKDYEQGGERQAARIIKHVVQPAVNDLARRLRNIELLLSAGNDEPDTPSGDIPEHVYDLATLRRFVEASFPGALTVEFFPDRKDISKRIRNSLVGAYDDITLHPTWTDAATRHLDAFVKSGVGIVDFSRGTTEPGKLELQWIVVGSE